VAHEGTEDMIRGAGLVVYGYSAEGEIETDALARSGLEVTRTPHVSNALELARYNRYDVVIVDLSSPDRAELATVRELSDLDPDIPVIVCVGKPYLKSVARTLEEHTFDCLQKPLDSATLLRTVQHAVEQRRLVLEHRHLTERDLPQKEDQRERLPQAENFQEALTAASTVLVGESWAMKEVRRQINEVAPTDMTVLLLGETGTGKDVVARLIHEMSLRFVSGAFVKICCPALPEQLLESEMFGHEAGAFTGAEKRKPGRLELAVGGSVLLDEIGDMPLTVQAKLLEVLEDKKFMRLGGNETIDLNARVLAAANSPLEHMCETGRFRADLYYRLNQYSIYIPPLRERVEDIPLLVSHFLDKYGPLYGNRRPSMSVETLSCLVNYPWPGNVRELESAIRRYALTGREEPMRSSLCSPGRTSVAVPVSGTYQENEKKIIMDALTRARWNRRRASEILGISYNTLRRRIAQYKLGAAAAGSANYLSGEPSSPIT
jgi:two-component system response regulator AtoC